LVTAGRWRPIGVDHRVDPRDADRCGHGLACQRSACAGAGPCDVRLEHAPR
jgi:hypothetical protein